MKIQLLLLSSLLLVVSILASVITATATATTTTTQRLETSIGTADTPAIPSSAVGFIGTYDTTDGSGNKIQYLIATDYRNSGVLKAVRSDTLQTVYEITTFGPGLGRSVVVSDVSGTDFAVVTTHWGAKLQAFRPSNGASIWSLDMNANENITCAPAISGNILAIRGNDTVRAGSISTATNPPGAMFSWNLLNFTMNAGGVATDEIAPLLYNDNKNIFVIDSARNIYGINIATQSAEWVHVHSTEIGSSNAIFFPELKRIMFLGMDKTLHSHNSETGVTAWKLYLNATEVCTSALLYEPTRKALFFGCNDNRIVAVNNLTSGYPGGEVLFSVNLPTEDSSSATIQITSGLVYSNEDSMLYFGDNIGRLFRVGLNLGVDDAFPIGTSNQNFSWSWATDLVVSSNTAAFTYVPILTSAPAAAINSIAVLGNQRQIYAFSTVNVTTTTTTTSTPTPPSPTGTTTPWIPVQFDIDIQVPTAPFQPSVFLSNLFTTLGYSSPSTQPMHEISRELPIGGPLYRLVVDFASQPVVGQIQGLTSTQRDDLKIVNITVNPSPIPSAAPVLSREVAGPLGVAIGVTCGIVAVFLALFFYGTWKSSQEPTPEELERAKFANEGRSTAHTEFTFKTGTNGDLDDVQAVNYDQASSTTWSPSKSQQQQQNSNSAESVSGTLPNNNNRGRTYSVSDDLLGSTSQMPEHLRQQQQQQQQQEPYGRSAAQFDANDL